MRALRVAIVGYGTVGQAAALLLARDRHRLDVFDRAPVPGPIGAGLLLQPTGLWALWRIGLLGETLRNLAPLIGYVRRALRGLDHGGPLTGSHTAQEGSP